MKGVWESRVMRGFWDNRKMKVFREGRVMRGFWESRVMREGTAQPERVLALLDAVLGMLAAMGAATLISCGGLLTTIKNLALYIGQRYRQLETPDGQPPSRASRRCSYPVLCLTLCLLPCLLVVCLVCTKTC
jgi:hypothetical protein